MSCSYLKGESNIKEMEMFTNTQEWRQYKNRNFRKKALALNIGEEMEHEFFAAYQTNGWSSKKNAMIEYWPYTSFESLEEYQQLLTKFQPEERHFYECIKSNRKCKPYFDLDYSKQFVEPETAQKIVKGFCEDLSNFIEKVYNISIDQNCFRIKNGSGIKNTSKGEVYVQSFHIIINDNFIIQNNNEYMQQLHDDLKKYYQKTNPPWYDWVDHLVYTTDRLMRCLHNKKYKDTERHFKKVGEHPDSDYFITTIDESLPILPISLSAKNINTKNHLPRVSHVPSKQYETKPPEEVKVKVQLLLNSLPYYFVKDYQLWSRIGWITKSIHAGLFDIFDKWSQKVMTVPENKHIYDKEACIQVWNSSYKGCQGFHTFYSLLKGYKLRFSPDIVKYDTNFNLMYESFPRYPLAKIIDNKFYKYDKVINTSDKFIKPEDLSLPPDFSYYNLFLKANCGSGKSDQTLALCANLVEQGQVDNGIICLAPNKSLVDSLHQRFSGQRLVKTTLDDGISTTYIPTDDPDWKPPHGHTGFSPKDIGMVHYHDPEYKNCLASKDGSPINIAICINSIVKLFKSHVERQVEIRQNYLESRGYSKIELQTKLKERREYFVNNDLNEKKIATKLDEHEIMLRNRGYTKSELDNKLSAFKVKLNKDKSVIAPSVLIIDEVLSFILNMDSTTMNNSRRTVIKYLTIMITNCKYLICIDAGINDEVIDIIRELRKDTPETYSKFVWYKKKSNFHLKCFEVHKLRFLNILNQKLEAYKKVFICSNLKGQGTDFFEAHIRKTFPDLKILSITSDTPEDIKRLTSNADKEFVKYDVVIVSPSVIFGVDFSGDYFDSVFGYYKNHTIMASMVYQQLRRIRNPSSGEIFICYDNIGYDKLIAGITEDKIEEAILKKTSSSYEKTSDNKTVKIEEEDIYDYSANFDGKDYTFFGKIYKQIVKFRLESTSNFSSWVRAFLCDEGIRYFSEMYPTKMPDELKNKLKQQARAAIEQCADWTFEKYADAPEVDDDPIGSNKIFHKLSFNLKSIDRDFFDKYIKSKQNEKLGNLKLFLMDDLEAKDIHTNEIAGEEFSEKVDFIQARTLINKLLKICCPDSKDVFDFASSFKTGDTLPQIDCDWLKNNVHYIVETFGSDTTRVAHKRLSRYEPPRNDIVNNNVSAAPNGTAEINQNRDVFQEKKTMISLTKKIIQDYLGLSVTNTSTRKRDESGKREYESKYWMEIEDIDERFELMMYMDEGNGCCDNFSKFLKSWAKDKDVPCKWYHLYKYKKPKKKQGEDTKQMKSKTIKEVAEEIYECKIIDDL